MHSGLMTRVLLPGAFLLLTLIPGPITAKEPSDFTIIPIVTLLAIPDTYSMNQGAVLTVPVASGITANDFHANDLSFNVSVITNGVDSGSVQVFQNGRFEYTPDADFIGTDEFSYRIRDSNGVTSDATVEISVFASPNRAPIAVDDLYFYSANTGVDVAVADGILTNDRDPDGDSLSVSVILDSTDNGTILVFPNGNFTYTPNPGFLGEDSFIYRMRDANGAGATATVTLRNGNRPPVAVIDYYGVERNGSLVIPVERGLLYNDYDPDGEDLRVSVITNGADHGTLLVFTNGNFSYTPDANYFGIDTFTYRIRDDSGTTAQGVVQIWVGTTPPPDIFLNGFEQP